MLTVIKFELSSEIRTLENLCPLPKSVVILMYLVFEYCVVKCVKCVYLADLENSVDQYFPSDQICNATGSHMGEKKNPFKVQKRQ